jgi:hypothetical protein
MPTILERINALAKKFTFSHILAGKSEKEVFTFLRDYFFDPTIDFEGYSFDEFSVVLVKNLGSYSYLLTNDDVREVYSILQDYTKKPSKK